MASTPDKKGNTSLLLAIGKKPSSGLDKAPPKYSAGPAPASLGDEPPVPEGPPDVEELGEGGDKLQPDKALYHGPEENCGSCQYFTAPSTCEKVDTMVDAGGHCWAYYTPKGGENVGLGGMPMMPPPSGPPPGGQIQ